MDRGRERWIAGITAALCAASRWLIGVAIIMTMIGATRLVLFPPEQIFAKLGLCLVLAFGAIQLYLAVRIEFDRQLFELLAEHGDGDAQRLADLDGAMRVLRLQNENETHQERDLTARAKGLISLIQWLAWVLVSQLALLAGLPWIY